MAAFFLVAAAGLQAQEPGGLELASLQGIFAHAKELYESPNQAACIPEFKQIIDALAIKPSRSQDESILLEKSIEYRARAYFNSGDDPSCTSDLRILLSIDPAHTINREEVSSKFLAQFEALRKSSVGALKVTSTPPGAQVSLDGQAVGATDTPELPTLAGTHKLRIERKGFETISEDVVVQAGQTLNRAYPLVRTAASLSVSTVPSGVDVSVDGQPAGRTPQGEGDTSKTLLIDGLAVGKHTIDFRKSCYESSAYTMTIDSVKDFQLDTITLQPSTATLSITSTLAGEGFIDATTSLGKLPVVGSKICSGAHTVEVVFAAGKYSQMISPKKDDVVTITATPRPTLVFLGVASDPSMEDRATDQEKQVGEMLRAVSTLNVICVGHSASQPILRRSGLSLNSFLSLDRTRTDEERRTFQEGLAKLCASLKAEMVCVGALYREKIQENLFLNFAAPPASAAESFYVDPNQGGLKGILAALNRPYSMYRSWIGVRTVDLVGRTAPVVLAVAPEGPAAAAGILPGMEVVEVAGKPVPTSAALLAAIDSTHPGDPIHLKVRDPRKDVQPRPLDLTTAASPVDVPAPIKGALVYSRLIAELSVAAKTVGGGLPHFLLAQCFLDLNDPASAFNEIQNATLGGSWGICDGTVFYYKGRILGQLGFRKEAGDAFRQALAFPRATLYDTDGRLVVDAAQRALRDLAP